MDFHKELTKIVEKVSTRPTTNSLGEPIASTPEGITNFWKWFGESKAVDSEGRPLVVHHGTSENGLKNDFFDPKQLGSVTKTKSAKAGFFFVDDLDTARGYSQNANSKPVSDLIKKSEMAEKAGKWDLANQLMAQAEKLDQSNKKENVVSTYLKILNPLVFDAENQNFLDIEEEIHFQIKKAKTNGNDALIVKNLIDNAYSGQRPANHYLVFSPNQIKSVTNNGSFNPDTLKISESIKSNEKQYKIPTVEITQDGQKFKTGFPVTFDFVHNTESATKLFGKPKKDSQFGRYFEPHGRYVTAVKNKENSQLTDKMISGTITFSNPLVIANNSLKWKEDLSKAFGGLRGRKLSMALIQKGYDGVVTVDNPGTDKAYVSEILDLTTFDENYGKKISEDDLSAWHGTGNPDPYDKFDYSKVGGPGGEGAQAYGYGLYFSNSKEIGEHYRKTLSSNIGGTTIFDPKTGEELAHYSPKKLAQTPQELAAWYVSTSTSGPKQIFSDARGKAIKKGESKEVISLLDKWVEIGAVNGNRGEGKLYNVDIPDDHEYLYWDGSIEEQNDLVKKFFKNQIHGYLLQAAKSDPKWGDYSDPKQATSGRTGKDLYKDLSEKLGSDKAASDALREAGVPGIRYLDGGSRADGEGTCNYVIFDDSRIKILAHENVNENFGSNEIPKIWYRGTQEFPKNVQTKSFSRFAYYQGAKPDKIKEPIPDEIVNLYNDGKLETINYLYPTANWKISRTYQGMSNFGFGIYFTNSIEWAQRYGDYITCVQISPNYILKIKWEERDIEGTTANKVMNYVRKNAGMNVRDQASYFYRAVKSVDKTKKAMYVEVSDGEGQLVVFDSTIIHSLATFNFKQTQTNESAQCVDCEVIRPHRSFKVDNVNESVDFDVKDYLEAPETEEQFDALMDSLQKKEQEAKAAGDKTLAFKYHRQFWHLAGEYKRSKKRKHFEQNPDFAAFLNRNGDMMEIIHKDPKNKGKYRVTAFYNGKPSGHVENLTADKAIDEVLYWEHPLSMQQAKEIMAKWNTTNENFSLDDYEDEEEFEFPNGFIDKDGNAIKVSIMHDTWCQHLGYKGYTDYVVKTGNIRWSEVTNSIVIGQPPTPEQIEVLKKLAKASPPVKMGEPLEVEVWNNKGFVDLISTRPNSDIWLSKVLSAAKKKKTKDNPYGKTLTESVDYSQKLDFFAKQDQKERNEYSKKLSSGKDWKEIAREYAKKKGRAPDDLFGDKTRLKQFWSMKNLPFDSFSKKDWFNYWLLSQHSDENLLFQKQALEQIKKHLGSNHEHAKYLADRISMSETGKQEFGTQKVLEKLFDSEESALNFILERGIMNATTKPANGRWQISVSLDPLSPDNIRVIPISFDDATALGTKLNKKVLKLSKPHWLDAQWIRTEPSKASEDIKNNLKSSKRMLVIVLDSNNEIIHGKDLFNAAIELGMKKVPVQAITFEKVLKESINDIDHWSSYAKDKTFATENSARNWLRIKTNDENLANHFPLHKVLDRWKIGPKKLIKAKLLKEDEITVTRSTFDDVAKSGLVSPGDIKKVDRPTWIPIEAITRSEEKSQKDKIYKIAHHISGKKVLKAIWIDEDNSIMDGHHRYEACKVLGFKKIPVQYVHLR